MRVTVTAVSPATRRRADVVIDADLDTPIAEIAAGLDSILNGGVLSRASFGARAAGHPGPLAAPVTQQRPPLFIAGQRGARRRSVRGLADPGRVSGQPG
jgi:hypothetical protein